MPLLLEKAFGMKRSQAQLARNFEAMQRLEAGDLREGELFRIVMGVAPISSAAPAPRPTSSAHMGASAVDQICIECFCPINERGEPLSSQPKRCRPCGSRKRRDHNAAQRSSSSPAQEMRTGADEGSPEEEETEEEEDWYKKYD